MFPLDFKCRIMETRDDLVVEEIVLLTGKPTSLKHEISVKVRSTNKGRRPMDPKVKAEKERSKLTEQQAAKREQYEAMIVANKDSVDLARDMQCPVRMFTLDPSCAFYYEAQLTVPECLLVEALYEDVDAFNTFRQVQALRSLAGVPIGGHIVDSKLKELLAPIAISARLVIFDPKLAAKENSAAKADACSLVMKKAHSLFFIFKRFFSR